MASSKTVFDATTPRLFATQSASIHFTAKVGLIASTVMFAYCAVSPPIEGARV
jgi:hypothetical protein